MYKVIGNVSTRAGRVLWMLEELGLSYEHIPAAPRSDQAKAVNPAGKVPVLMDGADAVTDSTAIMQYLADKHEALTFPAGTIDRARQDSMTQFLLDEFDACLWAAARHSFVLPEDKRVPAVRESLKWEFEISQRVLADRMGKHPFVMGEQMTVPDIILTHCLGWAEKAKFPLPDPKLAAYLSRMHNRPAFKRAMAK